MFEVMMVVCDKQNLTKKSVCRLLDYAPGNYNVVIVDNASTDAIVGVLSRRCSQEQIKLLRLKERVGPAAARSAGLRIAEADVVIAMDDDVWVQGDGWYEAMLGVLMEHPETALVGPCGSCVPAAITDNWTHHGYENAPYFGEATPSGVPGMLLDIIPGMCIAFRRERVVQVGFWDVCYDPFTAQDADLSLKLKSAGWDLRLAPVDVYHFGGGGQSHLLVERVTGESVNVTAGRSMGKFFKRWAGHEDIMVGNGEEGDG